MTKPPTLPEAGERGLLAPADQGIHTFSNGTAWDCWAAGNCWAPCRYYATDTAGALCAFEAASFLGIASPDLARLFGWVRREGNTQDGERFGWRAPESCRFFKAKDENDDDDRPPAPDPDPRQLVLIADPTEDAGMLRVVDMPEREPVSV